MNGEPRPDSRATRAQQENREQLVHLFEQTPIPMEELIVNLPLYTRSTIIAKILYLNELYELITPLPGVIFEFGIWWGMNMALFESLRAVHEPYNFTRRVVGFDTFEGYPQPGDGDGALRMGQYPVGHDYIDHLSRVLSYHQLENVTGHIQKYELVVGDASESIGPYLGKHPETIVALAYFDMALYRPTFDCLQAIKPRLVPGSVLAMDELNSTEFPGETVAFIDAIGLRANSMRRSKFLPDRTIVVIE